MSYNRTSFDCWLVVSSSSSASDSDRGTGVSAGAVVKGTMMSSGARWPIEAGLVGGYD